jgi:hypothetical protein
VRQFAASDAFGNFTSSQISRLIKPFMEARAGKAVASCLVRKKDQYRLYFNDKFSLHITFDNGNLVGMMPILHAHAMNCAGSYEASNGDEYLLAGGTNGYVYRMDKGTSFDGESILAYVNLAFSFMKSPRLRKRFRKAIYEISGGDYAEIEASYELGYTSAEIEQGVPLMLMTPFGSVNWDSFLWDQFFWDGRTLLPTEQEITGTAENLSLILKVDSEFYSPFKIDSVIIHYSQRRQLR